MRPTNLTPEQAARFQNRVRPMLSFLHQCRRRLERLDFVQDSELFQAVDKAHRAMHSLHVTLIYEAAGRGVWKPSGDPPASPDKQPSDGPYRRGGDVTGRTGSTSSQSQRDANVIDIHDRTGRDDQQKQQSDDNDHEPEGSLIA